jgi:predicted nicotinamide N-methyase
LSANAGRVPPTRRRFAGQHPLTDRTVTIGGRAWTLTAVEDQDALIGSVRTDADLEQFPYGLLLWASAIALAERLAEEPRLVAGKRVLELGAGVGLPGLVAQSLGGRVTQTDYQNDALTLARVNARQNGVDGVRYVLADWRDFNTGATPGPFDVILGSDVLYERGLHGALRRIFDTALAPGGLVLLADPLRPQGIEFADALERTESWVLALESRRVRWEASQRDSPCCFPQRGGICQ